MGMRTILYILLFKTSTAPFNALYSIMAKRKVSQEPEVKPADKAVVGARARKQFVPFGSSSAGGESATESATTTPKKAHKKTASFSMAPLSPAHDQEAPHLDDADAEAPKSSDSGHDLHARVKALEDKLHLLEQASGQPKTKKAKLAAASTGGEAAALSDAAQAPPKRRQKKVITWPWLNFQSSQKNSLTSTSVLPFSIVCRARTRPRRPRMRARRLQLNRLLSSSR